jgi:hypothetical protein
VDTDTNIFQSNGLCYKTCMGGNYAYGILKGNQCWCSNYTPATNTSGCDEGCPGYPQDICGSSSKNLYYYLKLPNNPLGTKGADSTVSPTSSVPIISTVTAPGSATTVIIVRYPLSAVYLCPLHTGCCLCRQEHRYLIFIIGSSWLTKFVPRLKHRPLSLLPKTKHHPIHHRQLPLQQHLALPVKRLQIYQVLP